MSGIEEVVAGEALEKAGVALTMGVLAGAASYQDQYNRSISKPVSSQVIETDIINQPSRVNSNNLTEPINSSISQVGRNSVNSFNLNTYKSVPSSTYGIAAGINTSPAPKKNNQMMWAW